MSDTEPQTTDGKVLWHFTMSLDGFMAEPRDGLDGRDLVASGTGRRVRQDHGRRAGWSRRLGRPPDPSAGMGAWDPVIFVLTHHPEDATAADGVTFLTCDPAEAVRIGLDAAGGKNLEVFSPTIGRQLLELGLVDEIDLHIAPILLGEGTRLYHHPGSEPIPCTGWGEDDPTSVVNVRYRPAATSAPHRAR